MLQFPHRRGPAETVPVYVPIPNAPFRENYLTRDLGAAGELTSGDPLTLPAGPGAIRPPPGPIRSISPSPVVAGPGAVRTLTGPLPPPPQGGTSPPRALR